MDSVIYSCSYIDFTLMDGSVTLTTEHHSYELPISSQLGDSYDDNGDNAQEYGDVTIVMEINLIIFVTLIMMMLLKMTIVDIVDNDNDVAEYETDISAQGQYCLTIDQHCQC